MFNTIIVFIDRLSKALVTISYKKTTTTKELIELYYVYVYRYYDLPNSIVFNYSP